MTTNRMLCDTALEPDGNVVMLKDAGVHGSGGAYIHPDIDSWDGTPQPALWVHTNRCHVCAMLGGRVDVEVLAGDDTSTFGELVFNGKLSVPSGIIVVGDPRDRGCQLLFGPPSTVDVSIFFDTAVAALHDDCASKEDPLKPPSALIVLLHGDPGFTAR